MKVSAIIPIHNATRYLKNLFKQLEEQTFTDFEALFINNGSTDRPESFFDSNTDPRFKLLTCGGKGVSIARNYGIEQCKGDYIAFIDADDEISPDYFEKLLNSILSHDSDISISGFLHVTKTEKEEIYYDLDEYYFDHDEIVKKVLVSFILPNRGNDLATAVWGKLIRRSCIKEDVRFPEEIRIGEDHLFLMRLFKYINSLSYINEPLYHYIGHASSALNTPIKDETDKELFLKLYKEDIASIGLTEEEVNFELFTYTYYFLLIKRDVIRNDYKEFKIDRKKFLNYKINKENSRLLTKNRKILRLLLKISAYLSYLVMRYFTKKYNKTLLP